LTDDESIRLCRCSDVLWRRVANCVVLLAPGAVDAVEVTEPGAALWELLATPSTRGELVDALADRYLTPPTVVQRDLEPVLSSLVERGLVEVTS
jgi:hypothetical protein